MAFVRDEGSVYNAPIDTVWKFLGASDQHAEAHRHRNVERKELPGNSGEYSWEQDFEGRSERFTMRWHAFPTFGIAYEVTAGPFVGSTFFVYYRARGDKTRVTVVGDFASQTIPSSRLESSVLAFLALEFEQDNAAIGKMADAK